MYSERCDKFSQTMLRTSFGSLPDVTWIVTIWLGNRRTGALKNALQEFTDMNFTSKNFLSINLHSYSFLFIHDRRLVHNWFQCIKLQLLRVICSLISRKLDNFQYNHNIVLTKLTREIRLTSNPTTTEEKSWVKTRQFCTFPVGKIHHFVCEIIRFDTPRITLLELCTSVRQVS
jgi:hypothetical protein